MSTLAELQAWCREAKARGDIVDWGPACDGAAIQIRTEQGWAPPDYGSDTAPDRINGTDPRDEHDAGFLTWRTT